MNSIDKIKEKLNIKNSETLFGLPLQPEDSCPIINSLIGDIELIASDIMYSDGTNLADIKQNLDWLDLEPIRDRTSDIRTWGAEWKFLAKKMFNYLNDDDKKKLIHLNLTDEQYNLIK